MEKYNVEYFIKKFEAIPEENWTINKFHETVDIQKPVKEKLFGFITYNSTTTESVLKCCAQGHCITPVIADFAVAKRSQGVMLEEVAKSYPEWHALITLFGFREDAEKSIIIAKINNGKDHRYMQETPKKRVLAALYDKLEEQKADKAMDAEIKKIAVENNLILN